MIFEYQWIELYDQANITNGPSKNQTRRCIVISSNTLMILEHAILQTQDMNQYATRPSRVSLLRPPFSQSLAWINAPILVLRISLFHDIEKTESKLGFVLRISVFLSLLFLSWLGGLLFWKDFSFFYQEISLRNFSRNKREIGFNQAHRKSR